MDHRGLLVTRRGLVIVGGMEKGQQVTAKVTVVKPALQAVTIVSIHALTDTLRGVYCVLVHRCPMPTILAPNYHEIR